PYVDLLSNRVFTREKTLCQRSIDDRDSCPGCRIALIEVATLELRNAERLEIPGRDNLKSGVITSGRMIQPGTDEPTAESESTAANREREYSRCRPHRRNRQNASNRLSEIGDIRTWLLVSRAG